MPQQPSDTTKAQVPHRSQVPPRFTYIVLGAAKASRVAQDSALYRGQPITATYNFTDAERKLSPRLAHVDSVVMQYIPLGNVPHGCHFGATDKELHSLLNHAMAYMEEEQWVCGRFHLVSHASGEAILQIAGSVNGHTTDSCWIF
ncbi:hypothetical protein OC845_005539 [Tilletia horrida]|nr:hypothetical protein OC845_005539 [Tilletia horrida]